MLRQLIFRDQSAEAKNSIPEFPKFLPSTLKIFYLNSFSQPHSQSTYLFLFFYFSTLMQHFFSLNQNCQGEFLPHKSYPLIFLSADLHFDLSLCAWDIRNNLYILSYSNQKQSIFCVIFCLL